MTKYEVSNNEGLYTKCGATLYPKSLQYIGFQLHLFTFLSDPDVNKLPNITHDLHSNRGPLANQPHDLVYQASCPFCYLLDEVIALSVLF